MTISRLQSGIIKRFQSLMGNNTYKIYLVLATAILLWCTVSWFAAKSYYLYRAEELIKLETQLSEVRSQDMADSIRRNLNNLSGTPDLLSKVSLIHKVLPRFGTSNRLSHQSYEERKERWTADPLLAELNRYLAIVNGSLNVDLIYVLNSAGDCIAASNWNTSSSLVGNNFVQRDYFQMAKGGRRGIQYAYGKVTHLPGLFFSSPLFIDDRFMGAVAAKINIPNLDFLTKQTDAFVVDRNGVIILAHDKEKEMLSLSDTPISKMTTSVKEFTYQKSDFPEMKITSWGDEDFSSLVRIQNEDVPSLLTSRELSEYGLTVYVEQKLSTFPDLKRNRVLLFIFLAFTGSLLILLMFGILLHLRSIKKASGLLLQQANYDTLTKFPNRRLFYDRLDQEIRKSHRSGMPLALLLIDLDSFKGVNDSLGHNMGDALLIEAAQRISRCVRESDTVARLGGDEFTVILSDYGNNTNIEHIAQNILNKIAEPFNLFKAYAYVTASIGIAIYPEDTTVMESLLKHADQAMYAAKQAGRNRFGYFIQTLEETAQKRMSMVNDLHKALAEKQLQVYYQPIIHLSTGAIHKAEALVRWLHPEHGFICPTEFIPVAESAGLITEIDNWVFQQAVKQIVPWRKLFYSDFQISVNKSPADFLTSSWKSEEKWIDYLKQNGLHGKNFCIEITEGMLMRTDVLMNDKLMEFRSAGIQVAIDDFGIGYSSFYYLKRFDIDYLKIDKSFIRDLATGSVDVTLCEAIILMAHKLGILVVAEGVETEQQRDILASIGCDYAQGYIFSRPVPPIEFEKLLEMSGCLQEI